jgi:hypothetical protein
MSEVLQDVVPASPVKSLADTIDKLRGLSGSAVAATSTHSSISRESEVPHNFGTSGACCFGDAIHAPQPSRSRGSQGQKH